MGKEFGSFLKRALKGLAKKGEINETFYARDTRFSVVLFKKKGKDQPLLLYMQNLGQRASALFSDATTEQLLRTGNGSLIRDALHRLGLRDILDQNGTTNGQQQKWERPALSPGYLIGHKDIAVLDIPGMAYDQPLGFGPLLFFHRPQQQQQKEEEESLPPVPTPSADVLPIEVRRRRDGVPPPADGNGKFDMEAYYGGLATKRLGKLLLYVPVCGTTMEVSGSLSRAFPLFDGILVVASTQLKGRGRAGNDWISPAGCAAFTFNFNIPLESQLGRSLCFLQHITAVSVASITFFSKLFRSLSGFT